MPVLMTRWQQQLIPLGMVTRLNEFWESWKTILGCRSDRVIAEPSGKIDFTPIKPMGTFSISGAFRQSKIIASIETTSDHSLWTHEGFVRDLSRKPGGLKANTYSLVPYSNNGDQDIVYLGDGWYVFQNLLDWRYRLWQQKNTKSAIAKPPKDGDHWSIAINSTPSWVKPRCRSAFFASITNNSCSDGK